MVGSWGGAFSYAHASPVLMGKLLRISVGDHVLGVVLTKCNGHVLYQGDYWSAQAALEEAHTYKTV